MRFQLDGILPRVRGSSGHDYRRRHGACLILLICLLLTSMLFRCKWNLVESTTVRGTLSPVERKGIVLDKEDNVELHWPQGVFANLDANWPSTSAILGSILASCWRSSRGSVVPAQRAAEPHDASFHLAADTLRYG